MNFKRIPYEIFIVFVLFSLSACTSGVVFDLNTKEAKRATKPLNAKLENITIIYPILRKRDMASIEPFTIIDEDEGEEWDGNESQNVSIFVNSSLVPLKKVGGFDFNLFEIDIFSGENNFRIKDIFEETLNHSLMQAEIFDNTSDNGVDLMVRLIDADSTFVRWSGHTKSYVFRYTISNKDNKILYQSDIASKNSEENPYTLGINIIKENVRTALRNNITKFIEDLIQNGFKKPVNIASKDSYKYFTCDETWGALKLGMPVQEVARILGPEVLSSYNETKKLKYNLGLGVLLFNQNGNLEDYGIRTCLNFITYDDK